MKNKKNKILGVAIVLVVIYLLGIYLPITGTVVDAETGQPIEGAVVLVDWTKTEGIGEHSTKSYKVEQVVTTKDGKFAVQGTMNWAVDSPNLTIYKKGYVAWSSRWIFPGSNRDDFRWRSGNLYKLEVFKESYSYVEHRDFVTLSINSTIGSEKKQLFLKIYNVSEEDQVIREWNNIYEQRRRGIVQRRGHIVR